MSNVSGVTFYFWDFMTLMRRELKYVQKHDFRIYMWGFEILLPNNT